jgi:hypothetical protein
MRTALGSKWRDVLRFGGAIAQRVGAPPPEHGGRGERLASTAREHARVRHHAGAVFPVGDPGGEGPKRAVRPSDGGGGAGEAVAPFEHTATLALGYSGRRLSGGVLTASAEN